MLATCLNKYREDISWHAMLFHVKEVKNHCIYLHLSFPSQHMDTTQRTGNQESHFQRYQETSGVADVIGRCG